MLRTTVGHVAAMATLLVVATSLPASVRSVVVPAKPVKAATPAVPQPGSPGRPASETPAAPAFWVAVDLGVVWSPAAGFGQASFERVQPPHQSDCLQSAALSPGLSGDERLSTPERCTLPEREFLPCAIRVTLAGHPPHAPPAA